MCGGVPHRLVSEHALRMVSSLRMQATMATFLGLPAAIRRLWKTLITGL